MTRLLASISAAISALLFAGCGGPLPPPGQTVGAEGGPCTSGGGCDPGLACRSDVCVDLGAEGEGEGECQGDAPAQSDIDDCDDIPAAACGPAEDNPVVTTCKDAALILRTGLFNAVYPCLDDITPSQCNDGAALNACFSALEACPNPPADALCAQAFNTCSGEGQPDFPQPACISDLIPTNQAFREAYAECFNNAAAEPCSTVHDFCYNVALATLIDASGP